MRSNNRNVFQLFAERKHRENNGISVGRKQIVCLRKETDKGRADSPETGRQRQRKCIGPFGQLCLRGKSQEVDGVFHASHDLVLGEIDAISARVQESEDALVIVEQAVYEYRADSIEATETVSKSLHTMLPWVPS